MVVRPNQIDPRMMQAIVAVEDKRFWEHRGVDVRGILRAAWADIRAKNVVEGGSTITQQFVKNAYVSNDRAIGRKLREAALAWQLEQRWSKLRILTAYLNTIYFGNGAYGVQQASITYFHHDARPMSLAEAALLAGIPKDPARYDPVSNPAVALARRNFVLRTMLDQGLVTAAAYRRARRTALPDPDTVGLPGTQGQAAQYFLNYVKQQLIDHYGSACVFGGGLRVRTSIDLDLQKLARTAIARVLRKPNGPAAALVAFDPRNGRVLAMVGGRNFSRSQFNLAVQGERQPGSAFKPFVLAEALEQGVSPVTRSSRDRSTSPSAAACGSYTTTRTTTSGSIDLRHGDQSLRQLGVRSADRARRPAQRRPAARGSSASRARCRTYFSIGLGAQAVNPLEMARAYGAFAHGGIRVDGSLFGNQPRAIVAVSEAHKGPAARRREPVRRPGL